MEKHMKALEELHNAIIANLEAGNVDGARELAKLAKEATKQIRALMTVAK